MHRSLKCLEDSRTSQTDGPVTESVNEQYEVEEGIWHMYSTLLKKRTNNGDGKEIRLNRAKHIEFLKNGLYKLSNAYESLDASRPWLCYWIIHSLNILGVPLTEKENESAGKFLLSCQVETGGFGGGPYQFPHLAATYAAINALVSVGTPRAFGVINRESLLKFITSMKLPNGSFKMHRGGEVDVRAAYCAVVAAKLTNLPMDELFVGTAAWIVSCQTFEGGFGACPLMEAHGGYTFCALAALILLNKVDLCDQDLLLRWIALRQLSLEGGFQGRTNKLVDGCYSFWQGASFSLIQTAQLSQGSLKETKNARKHLFNSYALQEYILICCQHPMGGLIDKPGKARDYYHTCYALSGLSAAQHPLDGSQTVLGHADNLVHKINPVYNLIVENVKKAETYFQALPQKPETKQQTRAEPSKSVL